MNHHEQAFEEYRRYVTRRWFFRQCGVGLGTAALGTLLGPGAVAPGLAAGASGAVDPMKPRAPHHAPRAKRVIYLFMAGAPSHLELFDHKPELAKWSG